MLDHTLKKTILITIVGCLFALTLCAQGYKALLGTWNMTSETDGDPVNWTLVLRDDNGKLAGFLTTDGGEQPAKDFSYKDGVLRFQAPYQGEYYDIELKQKDGKLDGSWSGNGNSGRTTGVKTEAR